MAGTPVNLSNRSLRFDSKMMGRFKNFPELIFCMFQNITSDINEVLINTLTRLDLLRPSIDDYWSFTAFLPRDAL